MLLALTLPVAARKPNYEVVFKIRNGRDTMMLMGYYKLRGNEVLDTAWIDKKGRFVFRSTSKTMEPGLYFFANQEGKYVEFVNYGEKPFFTFETEEGDWLANMKVKGSEQNEFFYDFHQKDMAITADLDRQQLLLDSADFARYRRQRLVELDSIKQSLILQHPGMFLSKMMLFTKENWPPRYKENGDTLTEQEAQEYYMTHYWDNLSLENDAMMRTPRAVYYDRVMAYFDRWLRYAMPETIIEYVDRYLDMVRPIPKMYQWSLVTLTQKYLQSNVMVHDAVYVHLVQKYYAADDNDWSSPSSIESELTRANKWERLLVGKEAPELILYDTLRIPHSLHALPGKWKLLIFWSPSCGHCQHIIPAVYKIFADHVQQYDLSVFAILSEPDDKNRKEWKKFLHDKGMDHPNWVNLDGGEANVDWHDVYDIQSTPQIYLLDEHNVIQAKKLTDASLENVLKALCEEMSQQ